MMERPLKIKRCQVCGASYETRGPNSKYCSACAAEKRRESVRASNKRRYWADVQASRETRRQSYAANKEPSQRYNAAWYNAHRKEILAKKKVETLTEEQRQRQREYQREYKRKMRAKEKERKQHDR